MSLQSWWEETSRLEAASNDCHERRKKKYPPFKKKEKKRKRPGCSGLPGPHPCASGAKLFQTGATTAQLRTVLNHNDRNRMNKSHQKKCQYRVFSCATFVSWESEKERRKEPLPGSQNGPKKPTWRNQWVESRFGRGLKGYSPSRSSFTSLAAFSPSSLRFLSIILDLSAAALSSWLTVQPMVPSARFRSAA